MGSRFDQETQCSAVTLRTMHTSDKHCISVCLPLKIARNSTTFLLRQQCFEMLPGKLQYVAM